MTHYQIIPKSNSGSLLLSQQSWRPISLSAAMTLLALQILGPCPPVCFFALYSKASPLRRPRQTSFVYTCAPRSFKYRTLLRMFCSNLPSYLSSDVRMSGLLSLPEQAIHLAPSPFALILSTLHESATTPLRQSYVRMTTFIVHSWTSLSALSNPLTCLIHVHLDLQKPDTWVRFPPLEHNLSRSSRLSYSRHRL